MTANDRAFAVASDDALVALVEAARRRLAVIARPLSGRVAAALACRLDSLDDLDGMVPMPSRELSRWCCVFRE